MKYYRIAGLTVEMDSLGRTAVQAEPYAISPPQASVDITIPRCPDELFKKHPEATEELCEYMFTGTLFYKQLIAFGGIMLHSSAVVVDGKAYLFTAPPGTGKSTHTSLYLKEFGDRAFILNDDKPAIRLENGCFFAYGTPWSGKTAENVNTRAILGGICVLKRGERNEIRRISGKEAFLGIYSETLRPKGPRDMNRVLDIIEGLIDRVPVWELKCNAEPDAVRVSFSAMSNP